MVDRARNGKVNGNGKAAGGRMKFPPSEFDISKMPPPLPQAKWDAKLIKAILKASKKGKPMIELSFRLTGSEDKGTEKYIKAKRVVRAWLVFPSTGDNGERMMKLNIRDFCTAFDIDQSTLPKGKLTEKAFAEFMAEIKAVKECTIWTALQKNDDGDDDARVVFKEPRGFSGGADDEEEEEETEDSDDEDEEEDEDEDTEDSDEEDEDEDEEDEDEEEDEEEEPKRGRKIAAKGKGKGGRPSARA
jgi:hypothetical protein